MVNPSSTALFWLVELLVEVELLLVTELLTTELLATELPPPTDPVNGELLELLELTDKKELLSIELPVPVEPVDVLLLESLKSCEDTEPLELVAPSWLLLERELSFPSMLSELDAWIDDTLDDGFACHSFEPPPQPTKPNKAPTTSKFDKRNIIISSAVN